MENLYTQIEKLNCMLHDNGSSYSVYPYNKHTIQEVICEMVTKINEVVGVVGEYTTLVKTFLDWVESEGLPTEVRKYLDEMLLDGRLADLINDVVMQEVNDKIDNIIANHLNISISDFGAKGDGITNDTQAIVQAIEKARVNGGGIVEIPVGVHIVEVNKIKLPSYVTLLGKGKSSVLKCINGGADGDFISLYSDTSQMVQLKELTLTGNVDNQFINSKINAISFVNSTSSSAIGNDSMFGEIDSRHHINNVHIERFTGNGLYVKGRGESQFHDVQIFKVNGTGLLMDTFDNWFSNISVGYCGGCGIDTGYSTNCRFTNTKSWMNGRVDNNEGWGFRINGHRIIVSGSETQDNVHGGFLIGGDCNEVVGCTLDTDGYIFDTLTPYSDGVALRISSTGEGNKVDCTIYDRQVRDMVYCIPTSVNINSSAKNNDVRVISVTTNNTKTSITDSTKLTNSIDVKSYNKTDMSLMEDMVNGVFNLTSYSNGFTALDGYTNRCVIDYRTKMCTANIGVSCPTLNKDSSRICAINPAWTTSGKHVGTLTVLKTDGTTYSMPCEAKTGGIDFLGVLNTNIGDKLYLNLTWKID